MPKGNVKDLEEENYLFDSYGIGKNIIKDTFFSSVYLINEVLIIKQKNRSYNYTLRICKLCSVLIITLI
jgi:hypothetical protein